ncbi:MAG: hypothetical protein ACRC28_01225 [Clostridium sp.]|uniref:hypothetical protein n=1 Tax=Clostridium sp. TaxID=1506 RepID=UPI003F410292
MKKILVLGLVIAIGLGLSSCGKSETIEEVIKKEDNTLVIVNNSNELFEKRADKDMEKVADNVDPFSVSYAHKLETTFGVSKDSKKIIAKTKKENRELEVGKTRGNKFGLAQGGMYKSIEPYKVSKDGSMVVILNSDNELYMVNSKGEFQLIEKMKADYDYNTSFNLKISDNGEYIYFLDKFNTLKVIKSDWKEAKILDENVRSFNISSAGKIVSYEKIEEEKSIILNIESNEKKIENYSYSEIELGDDGSYEIQRNYNEMHGTSSITYVDKEGRRHELGGNVFTGNGIGIACKRIGDTIYYSEFEEWGEEESYESRDTVKKYDLNTKKAEAVEGIGNRFVVMDKDIFFVEDGKYLKLEDGSVKLIDQEAEEISGQYKLIQSEEAIIYLSKGGKLFVNDEEIEKEVVNVVVSNGDIAYIDKLGKVKVMDIKTKKIENELEKGDIYRVIMYGTELLWKSEELNINDYSQ